ncbi:unnamed protein product [Cladocopium goreaui]|uniref:KDEL motif-containing protein 1 n=1 Tax=Cladocopium goreaui TaxID=2562237 RepID=A0A9P1DMX6_9DINO|nr:unnamed protein product [Cladocopium goreaui]
MSLVPADSAEAAKLVAGATAWQASASANNTLLDKWHNLFHAYDIQESGTISCGDFVKLEIRNGFEQGDLKRILRAFPTLKADSISKGRLDFMDFCKARLDSFEGATRVVPCVQQLLQVADRDLITTMAERFRMGPFYSWEVRKELKEVFSCWKSTSEAALSPSDWLMASKVVETECDAYLSEKWTGEQAFHSADANKDGLVQLEEFVSFSLSVFEVVFGRRTQDALQVLKKVCSREKRPLSFTVKLPVFLPHPPYTFQTPSFARHADCSFWHADDLELPSSITQLPDLLALLRLKLKLVGMSFSAFWQTSGPEKSLDLLSSENCSKILLSLFDAMAKATGPATLQYAIYVKNIRPKPVRLHEVHHQELQVNCLCPQILPMAMRWCLDWESHLVGYGRGPLRLPYNFTMGIGDALVLQLPTEESGISWKVFMTEDGVLGKPCLEQVQVVKGKKRKQVIQSIAAEMAVEGEAKPKPPKAAKPAKQRPQSGAVRAARMAFDRRLVLVAQKEGLCKFFIEMSWEHQEDVLCQGTLNLPASEASVGRLGPLQVSVERNSPKLPELQKAKGMAWWIGTRWSPKPVKAKGRPRSAR